jgi:hypothetical protein
MKAFPTPTFSINDEARVTTVGGEGGMDLRDYFAAMALQGLLAQQSEDYGYDNDIAIVRNAYNLADHMMEARKS